MQASDRGHGGGRHLIEVPIGGLLPDPEQPRRLFEEAPLAELAHSIARHGVLQPLLVTPLEGAGSARYRIVAGERRWRAATLAGVATVPAIVLHLAPGAGPEMALVENIQRSDLTPLELAQAYDALIRRDGLTQEELARRLGKSRVAITNTLRLLGLGYAAHRALASGMISEGHGRALLGAAGAAQERALTEVIERSLTVRQTEALVRRAARGSSPRRRVPAHAGLAQLEEALRRVLGTRVSVEGSDASGRIVIEYHSREELERLSERIGGDDLTAMLGG